MSEIEPLETAQTVAEVVGTSARSIYRAAQNGLLPSYVIGRQVRFRLSECLDALRREVQHEPLR